jgi:uncharacterized protein
MAGGPAGRGPGMRTLVLAALLHGADVAGAPEVGAPLPPLQVDDRGEATVAGDRVEWVPWDSDSLKGEWTLLQYLAARLGVDRLNRPVIDAVEAGSRGERHRRYRLVNIVNVEDVALGATGFAVGAIERNKLRYRHAPMVADRGRGAALWGLRPKTSAILLLDERNVVRFVGEGPLGDADVRRILQLLELPAGAGPPGR